MTSIGLRTTAYIVSDLKEAKIWYSRAFDTSPYFDESFYVGFNIAGYELGLLPEGNENKKGENVFAYWGVEDINKAYKNLISLGAISFEEPTNVGGDIVVAAVKDPWKNIIGLIYNPNFKLPI